MEKDIKKVIESLSPNERKIIPFLKEGDLDSINEKSNLDKVVILRALEFLSNKGIIITKTEKKQIVELGLNGLIYIKQGLPERRLVNLISEKGSVQLQDAKEKTNLSDNEFKAALGSLKKSATINILNGNIILISDKKTITNKTLEEKFLESLPKELKDLKPEERFAYDKLILRKNIINLQDKNIVKFTLTDFGQELIKQDLTKSSELLESLTPAVLKSNSWKTKKFRRYDITSQIPKIYGGKPHFVNQAIEYGKKIWLEMGFKEMVGTLTTSGFWNFDALFTAQDHPARELHDTFFIKDKTAKLPEKKFTENVKKAHEGKLKGSKGWQYQWQETDAKKVLLRTHTTCISAQTLTKLDKKDLPAKFFALGKCFRNDTVDWSHGFEFNQTEGIVIDENANLRQLLGYLKEFAKKMGYDKVRFRPHYFPYTEPSLEGDVWNEEKQEWMEVFAAGIFRPEVTEPLFGKPIPVLAWGPGFDRMIMMTMNISDLRELYKNDLNKLRAIKSWPI